MKILPIGGYFELELGPKKTFIHEDGVLLNSGRNALEFVLTSLPELSHLWVPFYTCEVVLSPLNKLGISYSFYRINKHLELQQDIALGKGDYLLYTNYFGIKDEYIKSLANRYGGHLIVDNAQALFAEPISDISTVYSPRKFVGIPDGGIAYCIHNNDVKLYNQDFSYDRFSHLIKRIDIGATEAYVDFKENGSKLQNLPILQMSKLTKALLYNIDFEEIRLRRMANFMVLHNALKDTNAFAIPDISTFKCPMVYPYLPNDELLKQKLIENKVFVATYWPNVFEWCNKGDWEYTLAEKTCYLPIDQRYGEAEMNAIINIINNR